MKYSFQVLVGVDKIERRYNDFRSTRKRPPFHLRKKIEIAAVSFQYAPSNSVHVSASMGMSKKSNAIGKLLPAGAGSKQRGKQLPFSGSKMQGRAALFRIARHALGMRSRDMMVN
jgi:hypothetical protein